MDTSIRPPARSLTSTELIRNPMPALWVHPLNVIRGAANPACTAFDAIFKGDARHFFLFNPVVHLGRTEVLALLGLALKARLLIFNNQMRLFIDFVANRVEFFGY